MTTPVTTDDLVQGAQKWLLGFADILAVLGVQQDTGTHYLFQHTLWAPMEGSESTAAVISRSPGGGWANPNMHNTIRFPRLAVEVWVDPQRDDGSNAVDPGEAQRRIDNAYQVIDRHLHRPQGDAQWWGTVRTLGCIRLGEPWTYPVPGGDGLLRLQVFYGVTQA